MTAAFVVLGISAALLLLGFFVGWRFRTRRGEVVALLLVLAALVTDGAAVALLVTA